MRDLLPLVELPWWMSLIMVVFVAMFVGLVIYVYSRRRADAYRAAEALPLNDD